MMKNKTLGIYDSGLGGYTIYLKLKQTYKNIDMVFYVDQYNFPVGVKSKTELEKIMDDAMTWFISMGIYDVFLGCNTASTIVEQLKVKYPMLNIMGIIDLTIQTVKEENQVMVLATKTAIQSEVYQKHLKEAYPYLEVIPFACTRFVDIVEKKLPISIEDEIKEVLAGYENSKISAILGCTHYSIVEKQVSDFTKGKCYDSIEASVKALKEYQFGSGNQRIVANANQTAFQNLIFEVFNEKENVEII